MTKWMYGCLLLLASSFGGMAVAGADQDSVHLNDGTVVQGRVIKETPGGPVRIQTPDGKVLVIPRARIDLVELAAKPAVEVPVMLVPPDEVAPVAPVIEAAPATPAAKATPATPAAKATPATPAAPAAKTVPSSAVKAEARVNVGGEAGFSVTVEVSSPEAREGRPVSAAGPDAEPLDEEALEAAEEARREAQRAAEEAILEAERAADDGGPWSPEPPPEEIHEEALEAAEAARREALEAAEEARREAHEAAEEARDEAEEARQEALEAAEEARKEALEEAGESRREALEEAEEARKEALEEAEEAREEAEEEAEEARGGRKIPGLAAGLALGVGAHTGVLGIGQFYNGEVARGLGYMGGGFGFLTLAGIGASRGEEGRQLVAAGLVGYGMLFVVSSIDAYRAAKRINHQRGYTAKRPKPTFLVSVDRVAPGDVRLELGAGVRF